MKLHVHPNEVERGDHVLAVDLPDAWRTHIDLGAGPTVLGFQHDDARHETTVALLVGAGQTDDAWRTWPDDADVTVLRRDNHTGSAA